MKSTIKFLTISVIVFVFTSNAFSQVPTYNLMIANDTVISPNVYEFDWYVQRTGTTPFELASVQMGLGFDVSILNGGTATATLISGTSALSNPSQTPTSIAIGSTTNTVGGITYRYINVAPTLPPGAGNGSIISSTGNCQAPGTRIIRVRITNSIPFALGTSCNHIFSTAVSAGIENTAIFAYVGGQNTYVGTPQNFNYNTPGTCTDNVVFNSCTAATLTAVVTNEACLNSSNGTINLTASGGSPSPTFSWSGPSNYTSILEDLSGLAPGQYTVTASSGTCSSTASFTVLAGPPNTTNTTTAAACNSYVWYGTTYNASGVYTGTTTNCVTQSLNLTITPSSTNTISVSACGTYTWPNNGQTYTISGVYTGTTANCVTQSLNLTITPNTSVTTTINANDTYTWAANGITYTASGIYTGPTSANCVTQYLDLTINSSGISEEEMVLFSLYPNPVSDMLYVNLNGQDKQDYLIIDNFGSVVKRGVLGNLINEISVSQLSAGLYYFKIEGSKPLKFSKID